MKLTYLTISIALCLTPLTAYAAKRILLRSETLSIDGIRLGDPFDVAKKLGDAQKFHEGDAAASAQKLCFNLDQGGIILFSASSEMGDGKIDEIRIEQPQFREEFFDAIDKLENYQQCGQSHVRLSDIVPPFGVKLGISTKDVIKILGKPNQIIDDGKIKQLQFYQTQVVPLGNTFPASWTVKACGTPEKTYFFVIFIDKSDKVVGLSVSKTEPVC